MSSSRAWLSVVRRLVIPGAAAFALLQAASAFAVLGGDLSTVTAAQSRMRAARVTTAAAQGTTVHELRLADGSAIREFVNANGVVYAVAWSTRLKPDFSYLLGAYANDFNAGVAASASAPGLKRSVAVERGDLVVHSSGRLGSFGGKAWLKSQMPAAQTPDAIR